MNCKICLKPFSPSHWSSLCLGCRLTLGDPKEKLREQKYQNIRAEYAGRSFASRGERDCFIYLSRLQKLNEIENLECQVSLRIPALSSRWVLDFRYTDLKKKVRVYADYKGFEGTYKWLLLKRSWAEHMSEPLAIYKGTGDRIVLAQWIEGNSNASRR